MAGVTDYSAHHFDPAHRSDPEAAIAGAPGRCRRQGAARAPAAVGVRRRASRLRPSALRPHARRPDLPVDVPRAPAAAVHRRAAPARRPLGLHQPRHRLLGTAEAARCAVGDHLPPAGAGIAVFAYLQSRIRGTASTGPGAPPPGLIAFYWHFVRQTKGWYALMFVTSLAVALIDTVIPVFIGKLVSLMEATDRQARARRAVAAARRHGRARARRAAAGDARRRRDPPQRAHPRRHQPDPLAEPLARGAPELAVLPERFRRPHRQPRDADRQRAARERDGEHPRGLVHRGLRHRARSR